VRTQLREPLVANADYQTMPAAIQAGFACGAVASVRFANGSPVSSMPICTEPQRPDNYNGIIETNLPSVHAMAVDYPHRRICFDIGNYTEEAAAPMPEREVPKGAWARFNYFRPPQKN
jgi:hypothetical protein